MNVILFLFIISLSKISIQSDLNVIIYVDDYLKEVRVNDVKRDISFKTGSCKQNSFIVNEFHPGDTISFVIENGVSYSGISAQLSIGNTKYSTENVALWKNLNNNIRVCDKISKETIGHFTLLPVNNFLATPEDKDVFSFLFPIDLQCTDVIFFPTGSSPYTIDMIKVIKPVIEDAPYDLIQIRFDSSLYFSSLSLNGSPLSYGCYSLLSIQSIQFNPTGQTWNENSFPFFSMALDNNWYKCQIHIILCDNDKSNTTGKCIQCNSSQKKLMEVDGKLKCVEWKEDKGIDNYFLDVDDIIKPCYITCLKCSGSGTSNNQQCIECKPNHSMKEDADDGNCYNNSSQIDQYYYHDDLFRKCYLTCKSCKDKGDEDNHKCTECITSDYLKEKENCNINCQFKYILSNDGIASCVSDCESIDAKEIFQLNQCVKSCPTSYPYEYNNTCYSSCPDDTITNGYDCLEYDSLSDTNDSFLHLSTSYDDYKDRIEENINKLVNQNLTIEGYDFINQVYYYDKSSEINSTNVSSIDLGECEAILKKENNIPANESLIISKFDIKSEDSSLSTNKVSYTVYSPNGIPLILSSCNKVPITISSPILNGDSINLDLAENMSKEGIDIYKGTSEFYNDICTSYSKNGTDIVLSDRRDVFYVNASFCSDGCEYKGINYTTSKAICDCYTISESSSSSEEDEDNDIKSAFSTSLHSTNIIVVKCYKLVFSSAIRNNIGFWFNGSLFLCEIALIIVFFDSGFHAINSRLNNALNNNIIQESTHITNINTNINQTATFTNSKYCDKCHDESYFSTKSIDNEYSSVTNNLTESITYIRPYIIKTNIYDMCPYSQALKIDQRKWYQIFFDIFREKQKIIRLFWKKSTFELFTVKLSVYLFSLSLDFALNALFFTDDIISQRYQNGGSLSFVTSMLKSLYSCITGVILSSVVTSMSSYFTFLECLLFEISTSAKYMMICKEYIFSVKKKLIRLFFVEIIFELLFWYYVSAFCAVYSSSQVNWFEGGWTSFLMSLLASLSICTILSVMRSLSLSTRSKNLYYLSEYIKRRI